MFSVSDGDQARIANAIREAEAKTSGEIFCVIAHSSGGYMGAPFAWAAIIALLAPIPLIASTPWSAFTVYVAQLVVFAMMAALLARPRWRVRLVPRAVREQRAHEEALRQFAAHGMQNTASRTGVLIFASAAERYAEIVADEGINSKVPQQVWDEAVDALIIAIRAGHAGDGFVAAIERCGAVLAEHFPPGALNRDELPNKVVVI
jgi:putative membrane protein